MSEALYASSAEVLSLCQDMKDDLEGLLDPQTGFAPRFWKICHDQYVMRGLHCAYATHPITQACRV